MIRRTLATLLVSAPAPVVLLAGPATAADAPVTGTTTAETEPAPQEPTQTTPARDPEPPATTPEAPAAPAPAPSSSPDPAPAPAPAPAPSGTTTTPDPPDASLGDAIPEGTRKPRPQRTTGKPRRKPARDKAAPSTPSSAPAGGTAAPAAAGTGAADGGAQAPPGALSPLGPTSVGVPSFFIDSFRIPPFLLPIYQAAGVQYGIRWEVLAAINEIETDYGRNLAVSSAGALGWMQFMPATWRAYGVDANLDGEKDPFNPVDAIFAAARYLRAAGADKDLSKAIFAYNHADWYVRDVLRRAKLVAALPTDLVSSLSGLTQGIFPVGAPGAQPNGPSPKLLPELEGRRQVRIRAGSGAAATAVTDGTIVAMGRSERLGRYVRLRDAYGNVYTYGGLRSFATEVPVPKPRSTSSDEIRLELGLPKRDPSPRLAASTTDDVADPAPLATATPARPADADAPAQSTAQAASVGSTTVVVAPAPRVPVRPPLPHAPGSSQEALEPPAGSSSPAQPVALPGAGAPVAATPAPEPQIDSPAATPPQDPPAETPAATVPSPVEPPVTATTPPAAPEAPTTPEPPAAVTTPEAPAETTPDAPTPAPPVITTPEPETQTTTPEPTTTSPAPAPEDPPAEPSAPAETETEAREEADPVLDPLLPGRQIELRPPEAGAEQAAQPPAAPAAEPEADAAPVTDERLDRSFTVDYDLAPRDVEYVPLRKGRRVIAGTVLGSVGSQEGDDGDQGELGFEIRPAGDQAPRIDPRPIVRGWRLLESTALYRARAVDVGKDTAVTTGQILLMDKQTLQRRVLANDRIDIYSCGRRDIEAGIVDRRVLATLEFLAANGLEPTVTSLRCGHGVYTASGNVSHHTTGTAVDIAAINGTPIIGHQGKGSITDQAVRKLLTLQGTMRPSQIITLMRYEGADNTMAMSDHHDHIHIGWRPGFEPSGERGQELESLLKPEQWSRLIRRLNKIENPKIPSAPSKYALKADRRADRLRRDGAGGSD